MDVGNATTEVVLYGDGAVMASGRVPTRGRKGSADSLRGAAALVRRLERQAGRHVDEARIAPLRAVDTGVVTVPDIPPDTGRLRVLAAGVPTPGGFGVCVGTPLSLGDSGCWSYEKRPARGADAAGHVVALVPAGVRYEVAARRVAEMLDAGVPVGAVLVAGDEGVLVANRVPAPVPVIDQVDVEAAASCLLLAVEVRDATRPLTLVTDPVALAARLGVTDAEANPVCQSLADRPNAVVGLLARAEHAAPAGAGPWLRTVDGDRYPIRDACALLGGWRPGTVRELDGAPVGDVFAVDLGSVADAATARHGSTVRGIVVATLHQDSGERHAHADQLGELLGLPATSPLSEPAAARLGALTTPGARADAVVIDLGAGTIDVIGPSGDVVAAGAGELLTVAVAELLGIPRAAADWAKRGPCVRIDGGERFEAEDGTRGFLGTAAPAAASGMLAVEGPGGWLPFSRHHTPSEWRILRRRIKHAVMQVNVARAVRALEAAASQILVVGGPAGDEELLGILAGPTPAGRGDLGGGLGHRYAVALGLALAE